MPIYKPKPKIPAAAFSIFYFLFSIFYLADAQISPQFLISWQAENYAPNWYQGKILPTKGTPVEINFELIDNGKIADLSKTKVRWYVNDELVKNEDNGLGIKKIKIIIPDYAGQETEITITVVNYKGGEQLDKIIKIPVVRPEAVINVPYPDGKIGYGVSVLEALPFFFNISNLAGLSVDWSASEQQAETGAINPWQLNLEVDPAAPPGFALRISATIKSFLNQMEFANKEINLLIK